MECRKWLLKIDIWMSNSDEIQELILDAGEQELHGLPEVGRDRGQSGLPVTGVTAT